MARDTRKGGSFDRRPKSRPPARPGAGPAHGGGGFGQVDSGAWLYGRHAVEAVLNNPRRTVLDLIGTRNGLGGVAHLTHPAVTRAQPVEPEVLDQRLPNGAVHQGIAVRVEPLPEQSLEDILASDADLLVMLDQVTDPQNVGAIFRSAAAFGVAAIIQQDRKAAPVSGAMAKAAAGAVELVADLRVTNLSRALELAHEAGWVSIGLAGETDRPLAQAVGAHKTVLVMGAEGKGLRQLVASHCTTTARIPIRPAMESLNVSVATGISLAFAREAIDRG